MKSSFESLLTTTINRIAKEQRKAWDDNLKFINTPYEELPVKFRERVGNMTEREFTNQVLFPTCYDILICIRLQEIRLLAQQEMRERYKCWWV